MLVLGIDPGTTVLGYGLVEDASDKPGLVSCGVVRCPRRLASAERLHFIYEELVSLISSYHPRVVATETPFIAHNVQAAFHIGRAQAVAMLAAAMFGLPVFEYSPATIKQAVTDHGDSSKEQVQEMVRLQLGLTQFPWPNDAADALAVAICHLYCKRQEDLIQG